MNSHQDYIDKYLNGEMDEKDRQSFLRLLEEDPALRQELEDQEKLADMIRLAAMHEELQSIHAGMEIVHSEPESAPAIPRRTLLARIPGKWWLAAASILLIVVGGDYFLATYYRSPEKKIFMAWYKPAPGLATTMGASQSDSRLMDAMVDYKTKEYTPAIAKFKAMSSGTDTVAVFYLAASYMAAGQYDSAYLYFGRLAGTQPLVSAGPYTGMAQWYEALCCIRLKKVTEARSILLDISGLAAHPYHEKAIKLSKELSAL